MTGLLNKIDLSFAETALFEGLQGYGRDLSRAGVLPWPTLRDEAWRYTNLSLLAKRQFRIIPRLEGALPEGVSKYLLPQGINLVFVNGVFSEALSTAYKSLSKFNIAFGADQDLCEVVKTRNDDPLFPALNKAAAGETLSIKVPKNVLLKEPIHILHVIDGKIGNPAIFPKLDVYLGPFAQATFLETFISFDQDEYLSVPVTDIRIDQGACLQRAQFHHHSSAGFHVGTTRVHQAKDSRTRSFLMTTGARVFRDNLSILIAGEGAEALLNGLHILKDERHADSHTFVEHQAPHSRSDQLYKCILQDKSHSIFNGRIFVDPLAQQTNSYQLNRNLILSQDCRIDTKPQLEIGADDVKCTHGATIGQLNKDELFYLQTRAINKQDAERMLVRGFIDDILLQITDPVLRDMAFKMAAL